MLTQNFQENQVVTDETLSFVHFVLPIRFDLKLASDRAAFNGNVAFSLSSKNGTSVFKKGFRFSENWFQS